MFVKNGRRWYGYVMSQESTVTIGPGGLVRITWVEGDELRAVVVRVASSPGGGLRVSELHVEGPTPVGLRELRLGAIERLVTHPDRRAEILERLDEPSPDVFASFGSVYIKSGTATIGRGRLERPRRLDAEFFRQLAAEHKNAVEAMLPVLPTLSARYGAPPDTVARWLKQARRSGYIETRRRGGGAEVKP